MPSTKNIFDSVNIASKEQIRRNIRHALSFNKSNTPIHIDLNTPLFEPSQDILMEFVSKFRSSGGIFIPCTKENFKERLLYLLNGKKYNALLNTNKSLEKILISGQIQHTDYIETDKPVDAVIVYSDILISRSGSIFFSQKHSLYPSVLNLGTDLIIVSFSEKIVPDLQTAFKVMESKYGGSLYEFSEVITPAGKLEEHEYTPKQPQIILFLIQ
ncbi:MAG: hypothetical protein RBS29_07275 [Bacteroidales bacterium]|jgi:L-lactate utilization protein LutC|nr:hypothetical protein [Bacteroidales bacterium]